MNLDLSDFGVFFCVHALFFFVVASRLFCKTVALLSKFVVLKIMASHLCCIVVTAVFIRVVAAAVAFR